MSARAMATATVSFGLVSIPVRLYSTGESASAVSFNWLHKKCSGRVKQKYWCPVDDEEVSNEDMVKGYEYAKGQYVLFTEEELKDLMAKATQTIEIAEFLPAELVDPVYFDKAYYLGPNKGGERPYKLLAQAMTDTGRWALARYAARGKQYLVLLRPFEEGLVMQQLRYSDEVRSFSEVPLGDSEVKAPELALAKQLVEQIASDEFHPENYKDDVRMKILELIEQKVEGREGMVAPTEEPKAQIIDLMEALKASLGSRPAGGSGETAERKPPKRSPRSSRGQADTAAGSGG